MQTKVVNKKTHKYDKYIGRPSLLGNPFRVDILGRKAAINLYREYFLHKIEKDRAFRKEVEDCRGKTLGCFCKPLACHGDIIVEWLNEN